MTITSDHTLHLNEKKINIHELQARLQQQFKGQTTVYLQADASIRWELLAQVMAELGEGKYQIRCVTKPLDGRANDHGPDELRRKCCMARPDPKGTAFTFAIVLHGSLVGAFLVLNWINSHGENLGDPNAGGASVGIEAVDKIPLAHSGPKNPVAHDSESEAPEAPPEKVAKEKEVIPPDAIKLNLHDEKKKAKAKEESVRRHLPSFNELEKNQLYSKTPQQVSSPLYSQLPGSGRVGMGREHHARGHRDLALYAQLIQDLDRAELEHGRCDGTDGATRDRDVRSDERWEHS